MKKLLNILFAGAILTFASCGNDDNVFDQTVSERIAKTVAQYKTALMLGERWVLEYWPDDELSYGGWVYVLEFKDDSTVQAWFEGNDFVPKAVFVSDPPVTVSEYQVEFSTATMLKFITQNDFLHYFAFPDGTNGGYQGRKGDFEFIMMSVSPTMDEIILKGSRTGNRMRMTPLSGQYSPEGYIKAVKSDQTSIHRKAFGINVNGERIGTMERASTTYTKDFTMYAESKMWTISYSYKQFTGATDEDGHPVYETVEVTDQLSVINLPGGIMKLYEPYVFKANATPGLAGKTMQTFQWTLGETSAQNGYICTDSSIDIALIP